MERSEGCSTYHTQAHPFVRVHEVRQYLGSGCNSDTLFVPQFVKTALHTKIAEPILTVLEALLVSKALWSLAFDTLQRCLRNNDLPQRPQPEFQAASD